MKIKQVLMGVIFVLMCAAVAISGSVNFSWEETGEENVVSYNIYQSQTSMGYFLPAPNNHLFDENKRIYTAWDPGVAHPNDETNGEFTRIAGNRVEINKDVTPDGRYYHVVSAVDEGGKESGASNECEIVINDTGPSDPKLFNCFVNTIN